MHDPLSEVGVDVSVFNETSSLFPTLVAGVKMLYDKPSYDVVVLTGGDLRNFIWFLLVLIFTRSKIVLRYGGDPLKVRYSMQKGLKANRKWFDYLLSKFGVLANRTMLKYADAVIVVGDYLLQGLSPALGRGVRTLVSAPVIKIAKPPNSVGEKITNENVRILTVTNLNYREKADGVITIARALAIYSERKKHGLEIEYDVVGGGYQLDYLRRSLADITELEGTRVNLLGYRNNVGEFYGLADLFVYCSTLDGYGLVICEAQSYGLPIIINRWGPFPGMLSEGHDSYFFDTENVDELSKILETLVENKSLRENLSIGAIANFKKNNSSTQCGNKLKKFLLELA